MSTRSKKATRKGPERRRHPRRPVLETFSLSAVVPRLGYHRLRVVDVSDRGLAIDIDADALAVDTLALAAGQKMEIHFYLNQSLYLPLEVLVQRFDAKKGLTRLGCEVLSTKGHYYKAYKAFLHLLDAINEGSQLA